MAGTSNYKIFLEAQLDPKKVQAQIKALGEKSVFLIKAQFNQGDFKKFEQELGAIKAKASSVGKITLFGDTAGNLNKGIVEYTDKLGNAVKQTVLLNSEVKITQRYTENLSRNLTEQNKLRSEAVKLTKKQADEMGRAELKARTFLESSKKSKSSPELTAARTTAQGIIQAVSDKDISKTRELNDQLKYQEGAWRGARSGMDSWTDGMKNSIKQTIQYGLSIGLIYGALNELKEGIQYVKDLNKEMVNIQLVTGGSKEEVAELALGYNDLAQEMSVSTLEIAKGSLEFVRQGKTAQETATLIKNSTMMSKLGNIEAAQSSEALTSIMNGFKLEVGETGEVVSKLVNKMCQNT